MSVFPSPSFCTVILVVISSLILFLTRALVTKMLNSRPGRRQEVLSDVPPGSSGLPFIGETLQFMAAINSGKGFYDFVQIRCRRYGNCFKTNIFGETHVFVSSTDSAKAILNNDSGKFTKRYIRSIGDLVGGKSLLCASHLHHKLIRSHLTNLFSAASVTHFIKQFDELVVKGLSGWENEPRIIILDQALEITCRAMCKMLMSLEDGSEFEMLKEDIAHVCHAMLAFPLRFPFTRFYRGLQARKRIMGTLEGIMERRRAGLEVGQEDFLQHLLMKSEKASRLTDTEIKDNILTMIIAGQDTTASAITWMVKYLGENKDVLDALRDEQLLIAEKLSTRPYLTLGNLNTMSYASKVVKESLRMASVVPWFPRLASENCEIEGIVRFNIRNGWNINIDARSIHLDPILYKDPNKFNPSRFNDDEFKPYSFLAFGMGGRTCLGMNMAKAMMTVFLHRLVTTYKWKLMDSDSSIEKWALFARLKTGCPVQVTRVGKDMP